MILVSKKRAGALSAALFLLGLAALAITEFWWPGIMLVIGLPLALRQYLLDRTYDMVVSLFLFVGTFVLVAFDISWKIFLPTIFTVGAIYILCREFLESKAEPEDEKEEDINHELEEHKKKKP
ncbi:MAG: hypothetical protein Q8L98_01015 [Chlamydiales bacterium]|nr:hypothetical protein [Chlamydiales bacterium]